MWEAGSREIFPKRGEITACCKSMEMTCRSCREKLTRKRGSISLGVRGGRWLSGSS